jgi:hypothetical protein
MGSPRNYLMQWFSTGMRVTVLREDAIGSWKLEATVLCGTVCSKVVPVQNAIDFAIGREQATQGQDCRDPAHWFRQPSSASLFLLSLACLLFQLY